MSGPKSSNKRVKTAGCVTLTSSNSDERQIRDELATTFCLDRSESEWLSTLLSADELRYIFEGPDHVEDKD
ncbi:hypothetical protein ACX0GZ_10665 [Sphingomonas aestuarii]|jgi:hypothetical protein